LALFIAGNRRGGREPVPFRFKVLRH